MGVDTQGHTHNVETIVITGANRGIGLELTKRFTSNGDRVIATCRDPDRARDLTSLDGALDVHRVEVTDDKNVAEFRDALGAQCIDVLINNAGVMGSDHQTIDSMDYDAWLEAFSVNTMAPFRLITELRDNLKPATRPRAVTLSSQMGSLARKSKGSHAYRSSKAAVNKVMQVLATELADDGIIVCPVHPGWVRTDMGGASADISVEESGAGLFKLVNALTMEQSGRFWTWNGEEHPW